MSPADGLALQLLQLTGGDSYVFSTHRRLDRDQPAVGDGEGFVADRDALGDALPHAGPRASVRGERRRDEHLNRQVLRAKACSSSSGPMLPRTWAESS